MIILNNSTIKGKTFLNPNLLQDGLILHLDASNLRSYVSGSTLWYDLTGNQHNGSLISNPTYNTLNGGSIVLDGTSYISVPDSPSLNTTGFTYEGWLKNTDTNLLWNRILSKKYSYSDSDGYEITLHTGTSQTMYISGAGSTFAVINNVANWTSGGWHHLVVLYNNTTVTVYCDGAYKGQGDINAVVSNTHPLFLGKIESEDTTQWVGNMANIKIYNKILTLGEITQNFNAFRTKFGL